MSEAGLLSERPTTGLKFDKKLSDTERSSRVIIMEKSPSTIGTHYRLSTLKEVNKHDPFDTGFDSFRCETSSVKLEKVGWGSCGCFDLRRFQQLSSHSRK